MSDTETREAELLLSREAELLLSREKTDAEQSRSKLKHFK